MIISECGQLPKKVVVPKTGKPYEFIYFVRIGDENERLFKIGTTNNIDRRMKEHSRYYHKYVTVLWIKKVTSKWTTLKVEEDNKQRWIDEGIVQYLRNDRFIIPPEITEVEIKIRKMYKIPLI